MADKFKRTSVAGNIEQIIYVRLMPDDDLLQAIWDTIEEYDIQTGVILEGSGALSQFRCQHFADNRYNAKFPTDVITLEGPVEASIQGTIGRLWIDDDYDRTQSSFPENFPEITKMFETSEDRWAMVGCPNGENGAPYVHAHCTCTNSSRTICGHLMPGSTISASQVLRDKGVPSHFTLIIAKVSGVKLVGRYGKDGFYHDLVKA